jgi:hypothetical protein
MNYTKFIILLGLISGCYCQAKEDISDEVKEQ